MEFQDLIKLYEEKKKKFGIETYKHISSLLKEAKELHKKDWLKIVEINTEGSYVMSETQVEESDKVKMFGKFIEDLKRLVIQ